MDRVEETPAKRRRTDSGFLAAHSQNDIFWTERADFSMHTQEEIPDTIPIDDDYETIPTLPLDAPLPKTPPRGAAHDDESDTLRTIPFTVQETPVHRHATPLQSSYTTQPTQIINQVPRSSSPDVPIPIVQVAASSSPARPSPKPPIRPGPGVLASRMAPPGTQFRPPRPYSAQTARPVPSRKPEPILLSSDDEGPTYVKDSDDDEAYSRDLKPTVIKGKRSPTEPGSTQTSFGGMLDQFFNSSVKSASPTASFSAAVQKSQTGDVMANAYGGVSRSSRPPQKQKAPAKAQVPDLEMTLDQIPDFRLREKVKRIREILPQQSVAKCYGALVTKRFNEEDAMDFLAAEEDPPEEAVVHVSEDELSSQAPSQSQKPAVKQQVQKKRTIQEKYARGSGIKASQISEDSQPVAAPKARGRLQRGRNPRPPVPESSPVATPKKAESREETPISIESESEVESETEIDPLVHGELLGFLNGCSVAGLVDLAQTTEDKADLVLSKRPFKNLEQIRQIFQAPPSKPGSKRKLKPVAVGDKIVDDCERMWTGFQAVDELVERCEMMGKPVAAAMEKWGVNVYGSKGDGELDIVNIDDIKSETSNKDSGIGSSPRSIQSGDENDILSPVKRARGNFFPQPASLAEGVTLKDYQVVGMNWLSLLFKNRLSCILADDMGLGKTCQVISFIAHLRESGVHGPHIIVVPSSVLENWLREFEHFCPDVNVVPYHANKNERDELMAQYYEDPPEVIVTTYTIAKKPEDRKFFKSLKPTCCIFDEGHMLKNPKSEVYRQLMRIPCEFRLLLTGTPLQNNLGELIALLGFMMPEVFSEQQENLQAIFGLKATTNEENNQHSALLSTQRIARAKSMMTPFILRRKKHQVLKDIPAKKREVQHCDMTATQAAHYKELTDLYREVVRRRNAGERINMTDDVNPMMKMRKAAIHPLLFRRHFTDETLREISHACRAEPEFAQSVPQYIYEDLEWASDMEMQRWCAKYNSTRKFMLSGQPWMDSGKVRALVELLQKYRENGDRVLIFSQFVMVLDILEEVMATMVMKFARLDGSLDINLRQDLIDKFYNDESITVFMLSTKAGGAGINLACANKVIIFDSSFNPQDDVQAENRAHRVGQKREVEVVRLVTRNTIEEQIHALGQAKLALDERIAGDVGDDAAASKAENANKKEVERMLAETLAADDA